MRRDGENAMKKLLLATVGLMAIGIAAPASAADMAVKAAPPPPVIAPIYNWTGFYIGGNGGWGDSHSCWDFVGPGGIVFSEGCRDRSGGVIGGQIGYRWQSASWVFGVEAQGDWADLSNTRLSLINPAFSTRTKTWHRPLHRSDRLCLERIAVLPEGRRSCDEQPFQHIGHA